MGFLDGLFAWFRRAPKAEAEDDAFEAMLAEPPPEPATPAAAPAKAAVSQRVVAAPPVAKPAPAPKPPKAAKPPKAPKAAKPPKPRKPRPAPPPAPERRSEVLSLEEAERRYGDLVRPKPVITPEPVVEPAPVAAVAPALTPAPVRPPIDPARRAEIADHRRQAKVPRFEALLTRADALLAVDEAELRHLKSARADLLDGWERLGSPPAEAAAALDVARSARLAQFDARIQAAEAALAAVYAEHVLARQAIIAEAVALAEREDLRGAGPAMGALRERLRACGPVSEADAAALSAAFAEAEKRLKVRQEGERAARDEARNTQIARLEGLVKSAEALVASRDPETAAERAKQLQGEWKTVRVPGPRGESDALWTRFRAACDAVFARRAEARVEANRVAVGRLEAIVAAAEALADGDGAVDIEEQIHKLILAWKKAGRAPREAQDALWERLQAAFGRLRSSQVVELDQDEGPAFRPFEALLKDRLR